MIPTDFPAPDDLSKPIIFSFIFPLPRRKFFFSIKRRLHGNTGQWSMKWDKERNSLLLTQIKIYLEPPWVYALSNSHFTKHSGSNVTLTWVCMCINSSYWKESKLFICVPQLLQWRNLMETYPLLFGKHPHFRGMRLFLRCKDLTRLSGHAAGVCEAPIDLQICFHTSLHLLWWRKQNCVMPGTFGQRPKKTLSHVPVSCTLAQAGDGAELGRSCKARAWHCASRQSQQSLCTDKLQLQLDIWSPSFSPEPVQRMRHF